MADNVYSFADRWRVHATPEQVSDIIGAPENFPRWWPGIYLDARVLDPGSATGLGRTVWFRSQGGQLLYVLEWTARTTGVSRPYGFAFDASGDFVGTGRWTFRPDGDWTKITFEWNISAEHPLLRIGSSFIKPVLAANHRWAMRIGEESLHRELARRQAQTESERAQVPPPVGPVTAQRVLPPLGAALAVGAAVGSLAGARR
jgi:hypothetical protein